MQINLMPIALRSSGLVCALALIYMVRLIFIEIRYDPIGIPDIIAPWVLSNFGCLGFWLFVFALTPRRWWKF